MVVHTIEQTAPAAPPPNSSESELQLPWRQQPEDIQSRLLLDLLLDASDDHTSPLHHSGMTSYGISANGGILMAVKCADSSTELAQQSASLLMQELQCSTKCVGEREIAYEQLEAWPFYEDVKELHIWAVRLMEGPHKGLTAVAIGGKKVQRLRAGRIALCLQAMYQGKIVGDPSLQPLFPFNDAPEDEQRNDVTHVAALCDVPRLPIPTPAERKAARMAAAGATAGPAWDKWDDDDDDDFAVVKARHRPKVAAVRRQR